MKVIALAYTILAGGVAFSGELNVEIGVAGIARTNGVAVFTIDVRVKNVAERPLWLAKLDGGYHSLGFREKSGEFAIEEMVGTVLRGPLEREELVLLRPGQSHSEKLAFTTKVEGGRHVVRYRNVKYFVESDVTKLEMEIHPIPVDREVRKGPDALQTQTAAKALGERSLLKEKCASKPVQIRFQE